MKEVFIYKLIDPITNKVRYVGKTNNLKRRLSAHIYKSKKLKHYCATWIKSLLKKSKKPIMEVIEKCEEDIWEEREKYWISFYGLENLTNITIGGEGSATYGRLGVPWTEEQRVNNRKARLGMKVNHTKQGKENRRKGLRKFFDRNKKEIFQYSLEDIFIKRWDSAVDAGIELGVNHSNITKVCKNQRNKCGGYKWKFKIN